MTDIAGVYTYQSLNNATVTVELSSTGVFTITGSPERSGTGNWSISPKNVITLDYDRKPASTYIGWFVADDATHGFAVVGGDGDGDWWGKMKRIR